MQELGEVVYFRAAKQAHCDHCGNDTGDLDYFQGRARILSRYKIEFGRWPTIKTCDCEGDCLCMKERDYTQTPEVVERISYSVEILNEELAGLTLEGIPHESLTTQPGLEEGYPPVLLQERLQRRTWTQGVVDLLSEQSSEEY